MRCRRRAWAVAVSLTILLALGVTTQSVVLIVAAVGLYSWLFVHQVRFLVESRPVFTLKQSVMTDTDRVATGELCKFTITIAAESAFPFDLTATADIPASVEATVRPETTLQSGERTAESTFDIKIPVVGRKTLGPLTAEFGDSAGLFTTSFRWENTTTIEVQPYAPRHLHIGAGGKELITRYGEHDTDQLGAGLKPYNVRSYAPGDQLSRIDWKATARLNHPHVREYEVTTTYSTALIVDHRAVMGQGVHHSKLDCLKELAISFVNTTESFGDPLGLYTVGDEGITNARNPDVGVDQYSSSRVWLDRLAPTEPANDNACVTSPATARAAGARLEDDRTEFGETLRSYLDARGAYVRRLHTRPLFRAVQLAHSRQGTGAWAIILTDDTDRSEVYEATKLAQQSKWRVLVFLAPSVLYEPGRLVDAERAYRRYQNFEEFRRSLARLDRVSAFEVAPRDKLQDVVDRQSDRSRLQSQDVTRSSPSGTFDRSKSGQTAVYEGTDRPGEAREYTDK